VSSTAHLRAALAVLAVFLGSGLWLEALLGLRSPLLLDDPLRRELLRLGHAHGGLLALVNVALGWGQERLRTPEALAGPARAVALAGGVAVGLGFIGGGLWHGPTDPGPLVLLVPAGAFGLLAALTLTVLARPDEPWLPRPPEQAGPRGDSDPGR
jgi:hypothetical protein